MTLRERQSAFAQSVAMLIQKAGVLGYDVTLGDAYRDPRVHGEIGVKMGYGHMKSAHKQRLAIDLNLYKDGVYQESTEAHRQLGEWWESLATDHRWGGRFNDGNHYSVEVGGVK